MDDKPNEFMTPFNGDFIGADGNVHNLSELFGGGGEDMTGSLGMDRSLDEKPVMVLDNGVIRQMKDENGDLVYQITKKGTITAGANSLATTILIDDPNIKHLLTANGWWVFDNPNGFSALVGSVGEANGFSSYMTFALGSSTKYVRFMSTSAFNRSGAGYSITIRYTR